MTERFAQAQRWNPTTYHGTVPFVRDFGKRVVDLLQPRAGERILDLGCGEGGLTIELIRTGASVVGVDGSPEFLAAARALDLDVRLMDGQRLTFDAEFDAVFSNAALHWMRDPDAVIAGVRRALKPEGRFVAGFGALGNASAINTALIAVLKRRGIGWSAGLPWYFPTLEEYRAKLETHGFCVETISMLPYFDHLPAGILGWLETFADSFVEGIDAKERADIFAEVIDLLAPILRDQKGAWYVHGTRLLFKATLPQLSN
ncbi:MAG TPA: class I SAM-dependent methyltransferase [Candidatus Baltobacteraceae bacterium]|jgi:SAM-dependent methyltransferase|nr:class I SAM-dependent methyltransferase [Candidatus Baltobacteraceae bacterium]